MIAEFQSKKRTVSVLCKTDGGKADYGRDRLKGALALILGILSANNILYVFVVGSTPIYLVCVYALVVNVFLAFKEPRGLSNSFAAVPGIFVLYLFCIGLSGISLLLYNPDFSYQYIVGLIQLFLYLNIVVTVLMLKDEFAWLVAGIVFGILANVAFSLYAYIEFQHGQIVTLDLLFPEAGIQVPNQWNDFRAQGLFKEPGHFSRYLAAMFFLVLWKRNDLGRVPMTAVLIVIIAVLGMTRSSAALLFVIAFFVYLFVGKGNGRSILAALAAVVAMIVGLGVLLFFPIDNYALLAARESLLDPFSGSSGNSVREAGFRYGLQLFVLHPITGSGWNTETQLFREFGFYGSGGSYGKADLFGSYSSLLTNLVQIGIPGTLALVVCFLQTGFGLLRKAKREGAPAVGAAVVFLLLMLASSDLGLADACSCIVLAVSFSLRAAEESPNSGGMKEIPAVQKTERMLWLDGRAAR